MLLWAERDGTRQPPATHEHKRDRCPALGVERADDFLKQGHGPFDEIVQARRVYGEVLSKRGIAEPPSDFRAEALVGDNDAFQIWLQPPLECSRLRSEANMIVKDLF